MEPNIRSSPPRSARDKQQISPNQPRPSRPKSRIKKSRDAAVEDNVDTYRPSFHNQILSSNCSEVKEKKKDVAQSFWGNVKPYWFNVSTQSPRIVISTSFVKSLLVNMLIIAILCVLLPIAIGHVVTRQVQVYADPPRLLYDLGRYLTNSILDSGQQAVILSSNGPIKMYGLYAYAAIWGCYQLVFLLLLLFGNPGYGQFLAQGQSAEQIKNEQLADSRKTLQKQKSKCSICRSVVDHTVIHCNICNLCCQGFSHHCQWVGKCIGYRNIVFLKGYFYGFVIGILVLIFVIMLETFGTN